MSKKACSSSYLYIIVYMLSMIGLFLQMDLQVLYSMGLFRGQCLKCIKLWHPLYNNSQLMLLCESRGKLCTKQCSLAFLCLFSQHCWYSINYSNKSRSISHCIWRSFSINNLASTLIPKLAP